MPNWRRGFFRLWLVLATTWVIFIGVVSMPGVLNPYTPTRYFGYDADGRLQEFALGTRNYENAVGADSGLFHRLSFKDSAPSVIYFGARLTMVIAGKHVALDEKYTSLSAEEQRETVQHIAADILGGNGFGELQNAAVLAAADQALAAGTVALGDGGDKEQIGAFAADLHERNVSESRQGKIQQMLMLGLIPPAAILILGAAIGWVLSGFAVRR